MALVYHLLFVLSTHFVIFFLTFFTKCDIVVSKAGISMAFKDVLRQLREEKGYTQAELGKKLGVSKSAISMWENGNRFPRFEDQEMIADFFNVPLDRLRGNDMGFSSVEEMQDELFEKRKLLFSLSSRVKPEDIDQVIKILSTFDVEK